MDLLLETLLFIGVLIAVILGIVLFIFVLFIAYLCIITMWRATKKVFGEDKTVEPVQRPAQKNVIKIHKRKE